MKSNYDGYIREYTELVYWSHFTDEENSPLYPFGFGLSYTTFDFSNLKLSSNELAMDGKMDITVTVKNTGSVVGEEVVQLYVRDLVGSISRPVKELKGFEKITLQAGESKDVSFTLTANDLAFYGITNEFKAEPGEFKLWVGPNSAEGLEASFVLK